MIERIVQIQDGDKRYGAQLMKIVKTFLGREDHGIMTVSLELHSGSNTAVAVGGYSLDTPREDASPGVRRIGTAFGMDQIIEIIDVVGAPSWEALVGRQVYVLFSDERPGLGVALGLAHTDEDRIVILQDPPHWWQFDPPKEKK